MGVDFLEWLQDIKPILVAFARRTTPISSFTGSSGFRR
jgi:hypothetical protein